MPGSPLMTIDEVAEMLRVHRSTIYRLIEHDGIKGCFKLGGQWRFNREAVEAWIKEKTDEDWRG